MEHFFRGGIFPVNSRGFCAFQNLKPFFLRTSFSLTFMCKMPPSTISNVNFLIHRYMKKNFAKISFVEHDLRIFQVTRKSWCSVTCKHESSCQIGEKIAQENILKNKGVDAQTCHDNVKFHHGIMRKTNLMHKNHKRYII